MRLLIVSLKHESPEIVDDVRKWLKKEPTFVDVPQPGWVERYWYVDASEDELDSVYDARCP